MRDISYIYMLIVVSLCLSIAHLIDDDCVNSETSASMTPSHGFAPGESESRKGVRR